MDEQRIEHDTAESGSDGRKKYSKPQVVEFGALSKLTGTDTLGYGNDSEAYQNPTAS